MLNLSDSIEGVILGTAIGDAIGLPREGLSPRRASRLFGPAPLEHSLLLGRGMVSDDTEHTCMVAEALLESGGDAERFARCFGRRLRWWLLRVPAGIGFGTLRAILKLWAGFPPGRSGVRSAGNGPAMRAAICGVYARGSLDRRRSLVAASTRITHTDARAEQGAMIIAEAAAYGSKAGGSGLDPRECEQILLPLATDPDLAGRLRIAIEQAAGGSSPPEFVRSMGFERGVSGFVNHTVPAAVFCWLRYSTDFRSAVEAAVSLGGDADTVGAITGGLAGATLGSAAIPPSWMNGLCDWPWSVARMKELADQLALAEDHPQRGRAVFWPAVLFRNGCFTAIVIGHALRRLLPPY